MRRDSNVYLRDILDAAEKIARYAEGADRETLAADSKTLDAIIRNLG